MSLITWFKSRISSSNSIENTEESKDDYNTTSSIDPCNIFADKYSEFSSDREYFGYSKDSRYKPNSIRNSHGPYSITCSIDFFIEEERKHYKLLDTYVFDTLSKIQLDLLNPHFKENDVIPSYDNIPINAYYKDAVLHMKKDNTQLDRWLEDIISQLKDYNNQAVEANLLIKSRIDTIIREKGLNGSDVSQVQKITEINRLAQSSLRYHIFGSADVYKTAQGFTMNKEERERLDPIIHDIVVDIVKDREITKKMAFLKGLQDTLYVVFVTIRNKAEQTRMAISEGSYGTRVDCCPTYWSLIRRFL